MGRTAASAARRSTDDYSGPFDPDFRYEDLSKEALVRLVREFALIVHILDRSMCAAIGMRYGGEEMKRLAIEEWRGASPVYGERLRKIMDIEGDGVPAIFKVLQLDPGFPHHYWTSTTRWSTRTTATSSWPTAAPSWTPSPGATRWSRACATTSRTAPSTSPPRP